VIYSVMLLMPIVLRGRSPSEAGGVALDEPGGVVAVDEAGHGLAQLLHGVVQLDPQALLLESADPALSTAVGLGLAPESGIAADAQPRQGAGEVGRAVLRPPRSMTVS
jgi:hypothetical protein